MAVWGGGVPFAPIYSIDTKYKPLKKSTSKCNVRYSSNVDISLAATVPGVANVADAPDSQVASSDCRHLYARHYL